MKATEIILEDNGQTEDLDAMKFYPEKIGRFMEENCRPWLSETNNGTEFVFRGTTATPPGNPEVFTKEIRQNRQSRDTSKEWTKVLNYIIDKAGGIANRSNSAFVTSKYSMAMDYGKPYVFMPIGDFNYTWSPDWQDWWSSLFDNQEWIHLFQDGFLDEYPELKETPKKFSKDLFWSGEWKEWLRPTVTEFIRADRGLRLAIKHENEIMVTSQKGLYIEGDLFEEVMKARLGG